MCSLVRRSTKYQRDDPRRKNDDTGFFPSVIPALLAAFSRFRGVASVDRCGCRDASFIFIEFLQPRRLVCGPWRRIGISTIFGSTRKTEY